MTEQQCVILFDAIDTCNNFMQTYRMKDNVARQREQDELIQRIKDDIQTVLRLENS